MVLSIGSKVITDRLRVDKLSHRFPGFMLVFNPTPCPSALLDRYADPEPGHLPLANTLCTSAYRWIWPT